MKKTRTTADADRVRKITDFLDDSTQDYMAARTLFLSSLPHQAAILSSTAIEKAFKALLAFHGNDSHGHLKTAHWNAVKNYDKNLFNSFNKDFLELNRKVYSTRYKEDLTPGFNIVIASREFLAELDKTVLRMHDCFQQSDVDEHRRMTKLEAFIKRGDIRILRDNAMLSQKNSQDFDYSVPQFIFEFRVLPNKTPFEATYTTNVKPTDASFMRQALKPGAGEGSFTFAFPHHCKPE